jgi:hypothetical protein
MRTVAFILAVAADESVDGDGEVRRAATSSVWLFRSCQVVGGAADGASCRDQHAPTLIQR